MTVTSQVRGGPGRTPVKSSLGLRVGVALTAHSSQSPVDSMKRSDGIVKPHADGPHGRNREMAGPEHEAELVDRGAGPP
jgi:hypothetical protein